MRALLKLFWLERNISLTGGFLFPILPYPVFPALAGGHVASGESQRCDVSIGNSHTSAAIFRQDAGETGSQRFPLAAVEDIAFDFAAVFASDGDIAAVVEGLFECGESFFWGSKGRHRAFKFLVRKSGNNF